MSCNNWTRQRMDWSQAISRYMASKGQNQIVLIEGSSLRHEGGGEGRGGGDELLVFALVWSRDITSEKMQVVGKHQTVLPFGWTDGSIHTGSPTHKNMQAKIQTKIQTNQKKQLCPTHQHTNCHVIHEPMIVKETLTNKHTNQASKLATQ